LSAFVIADTSAWVEFFRKTGSAADRGVEAAMRERSLLVTEPVLMELLAGTGSHDEWQDVQHLTLSCEFARLESPGDWIDAAALQRRMQLAGRTIASDFDCLIAVVAMRLDAAVLHKDADFDAIAEVAPLRVA
jgi:predicted nucleic acid-binding protein